MKFTVFIAGAGGIGQAAGLILAESEQVDAQIILGDISDQALEQAKEFIEQGTTKNKSVSTVLMPLEASNSELDKAIQEAHVVMDCLPGSQAPRLAQLALDHDAHYANLTEYVAETNAIIEMAEGASRGFVLQTGLAPGFINVLACALAEDFTELYGVDQYDEISMKVGALSDHAPSPHFYAFTWSPIGVATEYIKDAVVVRDYKTSTIPALSDTQSIIIDGQLYEDNFTSGGAADLPEAFDGRVNTLHYKTLRHPGHYDWVMSIIKDLPDNDAKIDKLEDTMLSQIGRVEDDNVVVYASVQGKDKNGHLRRLEKSYKVPPSKVGNRTLRAIQTTTAAPLVEMAVMLVKENMQGVVLQSEVPTKSFLNGEFVKKVYGGY